MSLLRAYFIFSFITIYVTLVNGHGGGAPASCCDTMTVIHDDVDGAQTGDSSYMVMTVSEVNATDSVDVWIMSNDQNAYFEGLLLKAIDADQASQGDLSGTAGYFTIADNDKDLYQYLSCSDTEQSAITHSSADNKTDVHFTWTAPKKAGSYVFVTTIVEDHDVYWHPFCSYPIKVVGSGVVGQANKLAVFVIALIAIVKCL